MAINIAHRPDLDERVERLAGALGWSGRGRKTAVIEKALATLEARLEAERPSRESIVEAINVFIRNGPRLRARALARNPHLDPNEPLSKSLQEALYDARGLPK